jgi:hypothetical protein
MAVFKLLKSIHIAGELKKAGDEIELPEATGQMWCKSGVVEKKAVKAKKKAKAEPEAE